MTDCKHTVSGTISLPSRGTFHLSLTVLTTLSVTPSIQAYRVVPADSQQIPRARCYSGNKNKTACMAFTYRTLTYSGRPFQASSAYHTRSIRRQLPHRHVFSPQPLTRNPGNGHTRDRFSQKSTFVRHYSRNHNCFLLQRVLRCFTSPPYLPTGYTFTGR